MQWCNDESGDSHTLHYIILYTAHVSVFGAVASEVVSHVVAIYVGTKDISS